MLHGIFWCCIILKYSDHNNFLTSWNLIKLNPFKSWGIILPLKQFWLICSYFLEGISVHNNQPAKVTLFKKIQEFSTSHRVKDVHFPSSHTLFYNKQVTCSTRKWEMKQLGCNHGQWCNKKKVIQSIWFSIY